VGGEVKEQEGLGSKLESNTRENLDILKTSQLMSTPQKTSGKEAGPCSKRKMHGLAEKRFVEGKRRAELKTFR